MDNRRVSLAYAVCVLLAGCANKDAPPVEPVVDMQGVTNQEQYQADLAKCQTAGAAVAERKRALVSNSSMPQMASLAATPSAALIGGVGQLGSLFAKMGMDEDKVEAIREDAVRNCLTKLGYTVLD